MSKIGLIVADVALPGEKGLGRLFYLSELFCRYGYEVELITSRFQHWSKAFRDEGFIGAVESNCEIVYLDELGYNKNVQIKRVLSRRVLAKNIKKHLVKNEYDLIYCQIPDNQIAAVAASYAKSRNIPFIIDVEDLWPEAMRMILDVPVVSDVLFSYFSYYAAKAYRKSTAVIGSSDRYRDEPRKYGVEIPERETVYVGNEIIAFDQGAVKNGNSVEKNEGEFWVTYAGTLGTSYDIPTLIRAADILKKRGIDSVRVVILGDGPIRGEFEKLASKLSGNVSFLGYAPYEYMAAYLVKSDVVINSLVKKAAQSIVSKIGDYLAAAKPMINTGVDKEFCDKVVTDGFGVNVEPENPEELADTIERLINNPELCSEMGKKARKIAEEQFDRPTSYMKIIKMADRLLKVQR